MLEAPANDSYEEFDLMPLEDFTKRIKSVSEVELTGLIGELYIRILTVEKRLGNEVEKRDDLDTITVIEGRELDSMSQEELIALKDRLEEKHKAAYEVAEVHDENNRYLDELRESSWEDTVLGGSDIK